MKLTKIEENGTNLPESRTLKKLKNEVPMLTKIFEMAGGSVVGRDHVGPANLLLGKNNQDAYATYIGNDFACAVVCDGCSGGISSEVGAKIAARLVVEKLTWMARTAVTTRRFPKPMDCRFWEVLKDEILYDIKILAKNIGQSMTEVVTNYFLFTIVGVFMDMDNTVVFGIGDGVFAVNGELTRIGPFPGNEPPYLAYGGLVKSSLEETSPELLQIKIHRTLPTDMVQSVLIGTDGVCDLIAAAEKNIPGKQKKVGGIHQFWQEDSYFKNSDAVRRKLSLTNSSVSTVNGETGTLSIEHGLLPDDTTLVAIRRKLKEEGA